MDDEGDPRRDVLPVPRREVVEYGNGVPGPDQPADKVPPDEATPAGTEYVHFRYSSVLGSSAASSPVGTLGSRYLVNSATARW